MTSLAATLAEAIARLSRAGVPSPEADAELLIGGVLELSRGAIQAQSLAGRDLSDQESRVIEALVARREGREPLQHLLGVAAFMGFEVQVGPGVFVPRPETEVLAERAIAHAQTLAVGEHAPRFVDVCSGSGVLAIALARAVPYADVVAVESSAEALEYLRHNAQTLAPEIKLWHCSVAQCTTRIDPGSIDLVVANPPYVPAGETPNDPEVSRFDPPVALYGGVDGLDVVRDVVELAFSALRPGAPVFIEHSNLQGEAVRGLLDSAGFRSVSTERDLTGRDRFSVGYRP